MHDAVENRSRKVGVTIQCLSDIRNKGNLSKSVLKKWWWLWKHLKVFYFTVDIIMMDYIIDYSIVNILFILL